MKESLFLQQYSYDAEAAKALEAQFGFESELLSLDRALVLYEPIFVAAEEWQQKTSDQRLDLLESHFATLRFGEKAKVFHNENLPPLHRDDTGNLEWILGPKENFSELLEEVNSINLQLGEGSYQATVSFPFERFFSKAESATETLGWLNFFHELDILERAAIGRLRWKQKGVPPLKTFLHPYLGPMIALRHKYQRKYLRENREGNFFDAENLSMARSRDHSFKYVGSTAYRPDIAGPERLSLEVRDAHRDLDLLKNRVARIIFFWSRGIGGFSRFSALEPFDSESAFSGFEAETQEWLKIVAARKIPEQVLNFPKPKFTHEVFRNFAYPLRNWSQWLKLLDGDSDRLQRAQSDYVKRISDLKAHCLSHSESLIHLQVFLCDFVMDSGIFEAFRREETKIVEDPT